MSSRVSNIGRLDQRIIRCDWDIGYTEDRQFGRGKSGGQVRDEFRKHYDPDRGDTPSSRYHRDKRNYRKRDYYDVS